MLLKVGYLVTCPMLALAVLLFRSDPAKDAELVLRHENAVLRRHVGRTRYEPTDRVWFTALAHLIPRRCWVKVFPVTPTTLPAWHRKLAARKYDTSRRRKPGRPPAIRSIARLVVRLAKQKPLWGYRRIHGAHERDLRTPHRHPAPPAPRPRADPRRSTPARRLIEYQVHYNTARPHQGIAQHVPDAELYARLPAVTDLDTGRIHRKPVLNGLINEYMHAA